MKHSLKFEKVKEYYASELWNKTRVINAVKKGWINEEEFEEITYEKFENKKEY